MKSPSKSEFEMLIPAALFFIKRHIFSLSLNSFMNKTLADAMFISTLSAAAYAASVLPVSPNARCTSSSICSTRKKNRILTKKHASSGRIIAASNVKNAVRQVHRGASPVWNGTGKYLRTQPSRGRDFFILFCFIRVDNLCFLFCFVFKLI